MTLRPMKESEFTPPQAISLLLVDDHDEDLLALEVILEDCGARLVKASSGREALRQVLREEFAVILLDVSMPEMSGFEVAELIKGRERTRHIPIIFLTARSKDLESIYRGYQAGGVDYILKPLDPDVVRAKVAVFVELYRRGEEIKWQAEQLRAAESERRVAELSELKELAEERERDLSREQCARADAERAVRLRDQILSNASHEMRTPLAAILLATQSISAQLSARPADLPRIGLNAKVLERAAERLSQLIDEMLDGSRIEEGSLELESRDVDLTEQIPRAS